MPEAHSVELRSRNSPCIFSHKGTGEGFRWPAVRRREPVTHLHQDRCVLTMRGRRNNSKLKEDSTRGDAKHRTVCLAAADAKLTCVI